MVVFGGGREEKRFFFVGIKISAAPFRVSSTSNEGKKRRAPFSSSSSSSSPTHSLSYTHTHLQVTEQQERVVDLDVEVVPASSLGHERAGEDEEVEGQKKGGSSNKETFDGTSARFFFGSKKKKKVEPFSAAFDESKEPGGLESVCERRVLRSRARGQEM